MAWVLWAAVGCGAADRGDTGPAWMGATAPDDGGSGPDETDGNVSTWSSGGGSSVSVSASATLGPA